MLKACPGHKRGDAAKVCCCASTRVPDDFVGLLQGIAQGLRARGIDGEFDLYEPEGIPEVAELIDLFECHLRLNGESVNGRTAGSTTRHTAREYRGR